MFIFGLGVVVYRCSSNELKRNASRAGDYVFLVLLALAGTTGFASEFASELNASNIIYAIYVVHLLCCAALLATAPFTKFVHAVGRPLLRLSENYLEAVENAHPLHLASSPKAE
jgi:nitrate reductase gamma subunit